MKILAIGAHPDDIEFGCGGTLLKYAAQGHDIHVLVMTQGQKGGDTGTRVSEEEAAMALLKPKTLFWGDYSDTELKPNLNELIHDIEAILTQVEPDLTLVHFGDDTHQDHRALSTATVTATRYIRNVLFYEGPTTQNFSPAVYVDIVDTMDGKLDMLLAHQSQVMKTNIEGSSIVDIARATAIFRGIQGRVRYAEAFVPLRLFININKPL